MARTTHKISFLCVECCIVLYYSKKPLTVWFVLRTGKIATMCSKSVHGLWVFIERYWGLYFTRRYLF